jgi:hypothetical protein
MQHEPQPLDYRTVPPVARVRTRLWLSQMVTAAALCLVAMFVDSRLRYDWFEARRVAQIEVALAVYGATCVIVSVARGPLAWRDKAAVAGSAFVFVLTAYVATLMPRVIHN